MFSPLNIISDHYRSIFTNGNRVTNLDFFWFFILPVVSSVFAWGLGKCPPTALYPTAITVLAIFTPLLFSVQISLLSILNIRWQFPADPVARALKKERLALRDSLLADLHSNVSYVIVLCVVMMTLILVCIALDFRGEVAFSVNSLFYVHLTVNIMLCIKRAHVLFTEEYLERKRVTEEFEC